MYHFTGHQHNVSYTREPRAMHQPLPVHSAKKTHQHPLFEPINQQAPRSPSTTKNNSTRKNNTSSLSPPHQISGIRHIRTHQSATTPIIINDTQNIARQKTTRHYHHPIKSSAAYAVFVRTHQSASAPIIINDTKNSTSNNNTSISPPPHKKSAGWQYSSIYTEQLTYKLDRVE